MFQFKISDSEFNLFRKFIYDYAGINLGEDKKTLVTSRLGKRLRHYVLDNFQDYFDIIMDSSHTAERQIAVDLLTTNETYFFREPKHFDFLQHQILPQWEESKPFRIWSAASSTGEEAYSTAMLLDDVLGNRPWEIFASDISSRVLKKAEQGHYLQSRIEGIPKAYLRKYCLKGKAEHEGTLLIDKSLRKRVSFSSVNLKKPYANLGFFEVIFLRNVLIYFDTQTKQHIIGQLVELLQPSGYMFIGHSESLKGINDRLEFIAPAIYRKL